MANQYAVGRIGAGDISLAQALLEQVELVMSNVSYDKESQSILATTYVNLGHIYKEQREFDLALDSLEKAYRIDKKNGDLIGVITIKLNKASLHDQLAELHEAFENANECIKLLEPKIDEMMNNKVDSELLTNKRFIDRVELYIMCYIRLIKIIQDSRKSSKKLEEKRSHSLRIAVRFLGENHTLTRKLGSLKRMDSVKIRSTSKFSHHSDSYASVRSFNSQEKPLSDSSLREIEHPDSFRDIPDIEPQSSFMEADAPIEKVFSTPTLQQIPDSPSLTPPTQQHIVSWRRSFRMPGTPLFAIPTRSAKYSHHDIRFDETAPEDKAVVEIIFKEDLSGLQMDSGLRMEDGMQVSKIQTNDNTDYLLTSALSYQQEAHFLIISAQQITQQQVLITPESLKILDLKDILSFIRISDCMPFSILPKFINDFHKISQYLLMPFMRVVADSSEDETLNDPSQPKKIELWSSATCIVGKKMTLHFLGEQIFINIFQLTTTSLRVVATNKDVEEQNDAKSFLIDIILNEKTAATQLQKNEKTESDDEVNHIIIDSIKIKDTHLITILENMFEVLEKQILDRVGKNTKFTFVTELKLLLMTRLYVKTKYLALITLYDDLRQSWDVCYTDVNGMIPSKHVKVPYYTIMQNFGVRVDRLDGSEYQLIAYYLLNTLKLELVSEQTMLLTFLPITNKLGQRKVIDFHNTLTVNLIATRREIIGIKITSTQNERLTEQGIFLAIEEDFYRKTVQNVPIKVRNSQITIQQTGNLKIRKAVLRKVLKDMQGWDVIFGKLRTDTDQGDVYLIDRTWRRSYVDSLENVLYFYS